MISLSMLEVAVLCEAAKLFERNGMSKNSRRIMELLGRIENIEQHVNHQEGATKVLPPLQGSPNQGCNASRYPYY